MEDLIPVLVVILIGAVSSIANVKKKQEKAAAEARRKAAASTRIQAAQEKLKAEQTTIYASPAPHPFSDVPGQIAPTVHAHIQPDCVTHDAPGSLGVTSMEGKDPCHEDQLITRHTVAKAPAPATGLSFDWTGDSMVKAVVMQEVLTRPVNRAPVARRAR